MVARSQGGEARNWKVARRVRYQESNVSNWALKECTEELVESIWGKCHQKGRGQTQRLYTKGERRLSR